MMPFVSRKKLRKDTVAVRQDVLIFGKPGNFMAEMHGPHALKQFVRKEKKNCRINFQCRRKNVIMVVYGKSDCGPCPI